MKYGTSEKCNECELPGLLGEILIERIIKEYKEKISEEDEAVIREIVDGGKDKDPSYYEGAIKMCSLFCETIGKELGEKHPMYKAWTILSVYCIKKYHELSELKEKQESKKSKWRKILGI